MANAPSSRERHVGGSVAATALDEPQLSRRRLTSRLLRPVDASDRRPTDLALGPRPLRASDAMVARRSLGARSSRAPGMEARGSARVDRLHCLIPVADRA